MNITKKVFFEALMLLLSTVSIHATNVEVTVNIPGSLEAAILAQVSDLSTVTSITISGTLNENDFYIIKNNLLNIEEIDMGNVDNNTLPYRSFYNLSKLKEVVIPFYLTSIGNEAFNNCYNLSSITIPNSVTSIGEFVFYGCSSLTSIDIPNSVTTIGGSAFHGCSSLTSVNIPNSVTSIGDCVFYGCSSLTSVTIGNSVTSIGNNAFRGCSSLTSVTIPNSVTSIGECVFFGCSSLTSVTIPNSVTSIGGSAFYGCSGLISVTIPNSVTSIGGSAFFGCSSLTSVNIPEGVTTIGDWTFRECSSLTSVTIPNSVTSIGNDAFCGCSSLTSVTIPNSVTSIGGSAFSGCSDLTSVSISEGVTTIGDYAFSGCSRLTSVTIPNSVTSIGNYAFHGCSGLTSIDIPNSVTNIGECVFYGCSGLTSIDIPNSVTNIGECVFYGCSSLTSVTIGNSVTSIGGSAFHGCSGLTSIDIPNSVTSIGNYAFRGCSNLTSVTIGNSVTSIGNYAFRGCSSLTSVNIPEGVTTIGDYAFSECSSLTSVTIPNSVTTIGVDAFSGCSGLTSVTIGNRVTSIGGSTFFGCSRLTSVNIPNSVTSIGLCVFYGCSGLTSIDIPNSVTTIGGYAFRGCSSLTSVTIGNSVTSIGECVFYGCSSLTSVDIPNSVTTIGGSAFYGCSRLTSVTISNNVTTIGGSAFYGCSRLTSVTIGNNVTSIGGSAFFGCSSLTSIYCFPITPPTCDSQTFYFCPISNCILYVPEGSEEAYTNADIWKNFGSIQPIISRITDEEWDILNNIRDELVANGWTTPWNMSGGKTHVTSLKGLTLENKHVVELDLSSCQLTGGIAASIYRLPYLEKLDLSNNNLMGEVTSSIPNTKDGQTAIPTTLKSINISHNQFTGNIGLFASQFPALQSLDASYNQLTEVDPIISPTVTTLNIGGQTINQTFDLDLTSSSQDNLFLSLPSLLRYSHAAQAFNGSVNLLCTTADINNYDINSNNSDQWGAIFTLDHDNECWSIPTVSNNYAYHGANGETLQTMLLDSNYQKTGSIFNLTLHFATGDANFNGDVDVTDLHSIILEAMAHHGRTPFNFTAANINGDEEINLLDVIKEVNLLMTRSTHNISKRAKLKAGSMSDAWVYVEDGKLFIHSDVPVAAFDIRVNHATLQALSHELSIAGLTCSTKVGNDGLHLIGYSLSDGKLPVGNTQVASLTGIGGTVSSAVLSDEFANKIPSLCNVIPTDIATSNRNRIDIQQKDGSFILFTDGRGGIISWCATTLDGRILGHGEVANDCIRSSSLNLLYHGMAIFTIQTGQQQIIRKTLYIK